MWQHAEAIRRGPLSQGVRKAGHPQRCLTMASPASCTFSSTATPPWAAAHGGGSVQAKE